jgi:hypothetical protein
MVLSGLSSATQLLQPGVFLLQLFQLPNQVDFQTDVLLLPGVVCSVIPTCRHNSTTGTPTSACFNSQCVSEKGEPIKVGLNFVTAFS